MLQGVKKSVGAFYIVNKLLVALYSFQQVSNRIQVFNKLVVLSYRYLTS